MKVKWKAAAAAAAVLGILLSACTSGGSRDAANYPKKGIEYIVPFSPGGGVDLVARAVAEYAGKAWGQPVTVVNKPGGGGAVGAQAALKGAAKDGYTVLADNNSSTSMLSAGLSTPPVAITDHLFVSKIVEDAPAFAVSADAPWADFKAFSDWAKAHPDQLTWTTVGPSGFSSFAVAEWMKAIGGDFSKSRMVTTKGASESAPMIAGGHAVLAVHTVAELYPLAQAGKIKLLAVVADQRSTFLPDVPTADEQGVTGLTVRWWTGLSLPAGTPDEIRAKWDALIAEMVQDPAFLEKLKNMKMEPAYLDSGKFSEWVGNESNYLTDLAAKYGIRK
ncbi:tripartite tricarboxylate transporter substrate binding protein [Paenibacillus mucilaginosus]|uniref:Putative transport protein n=1 Tax=Paenibacillus mucilaginosus (strain KNP414) TaxID=1036673 RepID=F8FB24_PAEMK|nr:tripartite tricarboxylate transporter substrate binding protein [Paenibacillus mucilaginosus]AEI41667.1 putative transport protein [Paenibacillus mucilaginosus KNP414]MCG7214365.1 tripartite tricarboxylate transporter substrate binding protein [Paenibacillus mucilaginosus]WDM30652.1 tripartite tricarboxylate transporter substrate binding protein [Paenibacillus mucilaginosus]